MRRREFAIRIVINGRRIIKVIVDPHYEEKHAESITDEIILKLVKTLDGEMIMPEVESPPFAYFAQDKIELEGKLYRLIWLLEDDRDYIGIVNAYRRQLWDFPAKLR
jgi:hypothetical protein